MLAHLGTTPAVVVVVLVAFGTAKITKLRAQTTEIIQEVRASAHERRGTPTHLSAVAIQADALRQRGDVSFL